MSPSRLLLLPLLMKLCMVWSMYKEPEITEDSLFERQYTLIQRSSDPPETFKDHFKPKYFEESHFTSLSKDGKKTNENQSLVDFDKSYQQPTSNRVKLRSHKENEDKDEEKKTDEEVIEENKKIREDNVYLQTRPLLPVKPIINHIKAKKHSLKPIVPALPHRLSPSKLVIRNILRPRRIFFPHRPLAPRSPILGSVQTNPNENSESEDSNEEILQQILSPNGHGKSNDFKNALVKKITSYNITKVIDANEELKFVLQKNQNISVGMTFLDAKGRETSHFDSLSNRVQTDLGPEVFEEDFFQEEDKTGKISGKNSNENTILGLYQQHPSHYEFVGGGYVPVHQQNHHDDRDIGDLVMLPNNLHDNPDTASMPESTTFSELKNIPYIQDGKEEVTMKGSETENQYNNDNAHFTSGSTKQMGTDTVHTTTSENPEEATLFSTKIGNLKYTTTYESNIKSTDNLTDFPTQNTEEPVDKIVTLESDFETTTQILDILTKKGNSIFVRKTNVDHSVSDNDDTNNLQRGGNEIKSQGNMVQSRNNENISESETSLDSNESDYIHEDYDDTIGEKDTASSILATNIQTGDYVTQFVTPHSLDLTTDSNNYAQSRDAQSKSLYDIPPPTLPVADLSGEFSNINAQKTKVDKEKLEIDFSEPTESGEVSSDFMLSSVNDNVVESTETEALSHDVEIYAGETSKQGKYTTESEELGDTEQSTERNKSLEEREDSTNNYSKELCFSIKNKKEEISLYDLLSGKFYVENDDIKTPLQLEFNPLKNCNSGTKNCKLYIDFIGKLKNPKTKNSIKLERKIHKREIKEEAVSENKKETEKLIEALSKDSNISKSNSILNRNKTHSSLNQKFFDDTLYKNVYEQKESKNKCSSNPSHLIPKIKNIPKKNLLTIPDMFNTPRTIKIRQNDPNLKLNNDENDSRNLLYSLNPISESTNPEDLTLSKKRFPRTLPDDKSFSAEEEKKGKCGCESTSMLGRTLPPIPHYNHFLGKRLNIITDIALAIKDLALHPPPLPVIK